MLDSESAPDFAAFQASAATSGPPVVVPARPRYFDVIGLEFLGGSASGSYDFTPVLSGAEVPVLPTAGRWALAC